MLDKIEARRKYHREWARKQYGHKPARRVTDEARAQILHLASLGFSNSEVAFLTNWSRPCVEKIVAQAGGMRKLRGGQPMRYGPSKPIDRKRYSVRRKLGQARKLAIRLLMAEWTREDVAFLLQLPSDVVRQIDERVL